MTWDAAQILDSTSDIVLSHCEGMQRLNYDILWDLSVSADRFDGKNHRSVFKTKANI